MSFSIIIIHTKIMPYIINKFAVNKNSDTIACFAIFPELMNTDIVWKLITIIGEQIIRAAGIGHTNFLKQKLSLTNAFFRLSKFLVKLLILRWRTENEMSLFSFIIFLMFQV